MHKTDAPIFIVTCHYGLEGMLAEEVYKLFGIKSSRSWCEVSFPWDGDPVRLKEITLARNLFIELARFQLEPEVNERIMLREHFERMPVQLWLKLWKQINGDDAPAISLKVTRIGRHSFTHKYVRNLLHEALRLQVKHPLTEGASALELVAELKAEHVLVKGRLAAAPLSHRFYQVRRFDGATDPTIARAMVRLGNPGPKDTFLDPFCGCGTIPIERALERGFRRIVAGDIRDKRLEQTRINLEKTGLEFEVVKLDAFSLDFGPRSFSHIVAHPPQSDPETGRRWPVRKFQTLLEELFRVLDYGGVMVVFGMDAQLLRHAGYGITACRFQKKLTCSICGQKRHIFILSKDL